MKAALICLLLALVPLSGLRIVCVTAPASSDGISALAEQQDAAAEECERVCRRHPGAAATPAPHARTVMTCLLVPDPTCELIAGDAPALLPAACGLPRVDGDAPVVGSSLTRYVPNEPPLPSPPPRLPL